MHSQDYSWSYRSVLFFTVHEFCNREKDNSRILWLSKNGVAHLICDAKFCCPFGDSSFALVCIPEMASSSPGSWLVPVWDITFLNNQIIHFFFLIKTLLAAYTKTSYLPGHFLKAIFKGFKWLCSSTSTRTCSLPWPPLTSWCQWSVSACICGPCNEDSVFNEINLTISSKIANPQEVIACVKECTKELHHDYNTNNWMGRGWKQCICNTVPWHITSSNYPQWWLWTLHNTKNTL